MPERTIAFTLNGRPVTVTAPPFRRLLDLLREELAQTGTKEGCGEGECGACSVVLDGRLVNSCLIPAIQADGAVITTIEAVADTPLGAAVQKAFVEHGGAQCGICTPGMIMAAWWVAGHRDALPPGAGLRDLMAGNLCRCTGYDLIVTSIERAIAAEPASAGAAPHEGAAPPAAEAPGRTTDGGAAR